ncbi:Uncharacterised protein [Mycobacterium tuberculosis]|nr:Uncharacterised protein [Mycobacterium tuberculosis]CNW35214.1 Uncharacterised protein [Mycobacterium tuberculosis]SGO67464.1 Uncharacterised protein [Mycobacterium tuberculosis]
MSSGHQQRHTLGQRPVFVDVGGQVPAQMIHRIERHPPSSRICLGRSHSHQQGAREPGTDGGRDNVWLFQAGGRQRAAHRGTQCLQVRTGGNLGDHAAEPNMLVDTGSHLVGQQCHGAIGIEPRDADTGFIAGGFDAQDCRHDGSPESLRIVYASAPLTR